MKLLLTAGVAGVLLFASCTSPVSVVQTETFVKIVQVVDSSVRYTDFIFLSVDTCDGFQQPVQVVVGDTLGVLMETGNIFSLSFAYMAEKKLFNKHLNFKASVDTTVVLGKD